MAQRLTLEQLLALLSSDLQAAFLASIQSIMDTALVGELVAAIEEGNAQRAYEILGFNAAALRPLTAAIQRVFERSGDWTTEQYPRQPGYPIFRFDVRNPRAEEWIRAKSSELVTRISEDARNNVRETLQDGITRGVNPRQTALNIIGRVDQGTGQRVGGVIGLTQQQEGWVRSLRTYLAQGSDRYFDLTLRDKRFDSTVRAAFDSGKPLSADMIEKLVTRYTSSALRHRGEMIGRTESLLAFNTAEYESTRQVIDTGAVTESDVEREWDSAGDRRVRPTHVQMDGQKRGIGEPFVSPSGARMMHPGDRSLGAPSSEIILCRCQARTSIDWIGAALRRMRNGG
jgi:hypothetical protein